MPSVDQWGYLTAEAATSLLLQWGFKLVEYCSYTYTFGGVEVVVYQSGRLTIQGPPIGRVLFDEAMTPADFDSAICLAMTSWS